MAWRRLRDDAGFAPVSDDRTYDEASAEVYDQWFGSCEGQP